MVQCIDCTIEQDLKVWGNAGIADSKIGRQLMISGLKSTISDSEVGSILVEKSNKAQAQTIELKGTTVEGDIVFKSGQGKVILRNDAQVSGQIKGATVERK